MLLYVFFLIITYANEKISIPIVMEPFSLPVYYHLFIFTYIVSGLQFFHGMALRFPSLCLIFISLLTYCVGRHIVILSNHV